MISKSLPANSVYHTCRYVCNRVEAEVLYSEGVRAHNYKLMATDFQMQQQMRPSKKAGCFHAILSFHPDEKLSDPLLVEISQKYLEQLKIVNTQYAIVKHTDKAHLHLHIIANMVDNNGKSINDSFIGLRGKKIAQRLTQEYKLVPAIKKDLTLTHLENLNETEANRYKIYMAIANNLPHCRTMQDLEGRLQKLDIQIQYKYKGNTLEKQGISFKSGNFCFKGSQVDRKYSLAGLEKALAQQHKEVVEQEQDVKTEISQVQTEDPKQVLRKIIRKKNTATTQTQDGADGKNIASDMAKAMGKIMDDLLKTEETHESMPYEFTYKGYQRKQKKKNRKHKL